MPSDGIAPAPATLDIAHEYVRRGWRVVPIPRGEKALRQRETMGPKMHVGQLAFEKLLDK